MNEYRNAIVTGLRELEEKFKESKVLRPRAETAREVFEQLFYILDDTGFDTECSSRNILGRLAELIEDNGNADEVYSTEVVVTNMTEATNKTRNLFPEWQRVSVITSPDRTYDLHDEGDHVSLFITTQPDDMPVEFRKKYRLTISEVADEPDHD
jgi:hypothetical protein